jgi:alpha-tubulin suppressor-like RCC1 family protein
VVVVRSTTTRVVHKLYTRTFPAGKITLGANYASGTTGMYTVILPPVPGARGPWVAATTGWHHSCALDTNGKAYCWGANLNGQLGLGNYQDVLIPTAVPTSLTFTDLTGGANHSCGVASNGAGYCWGKNDYGQLGDGSLTNTNRPVAVAGGLRFRMINAGQHHTCGLTTDGKAYCWGRNQRGQNGSDSPSAQVFTSPNLVSGGHTWQAVTVGYNHACGLTSAGTAYCWGQNRLGQVGDDTYLDRRIPTPVVGGFVFGSPIAEMSIEGSQGDTCGIGTTGRAHCWGDQWHNQLGTNVGRGDSPRPTTVVGVPDFDRIAVGGDHACALTPAGAAWCWGDNMRWALAREEQLDYNPAQQVETGFRFENLSGGWDHYCGVTTQGDMVCWGFNRNGQIGDGTTIRRFTPVLLRFP